MAALGLRFCARAFSSCGKRGPLFIVVRGPLTIAASLVAEHRLQTRRLSNCGSWAQLLRGMWDLSQTRARTRVPCICRQTLNHYATREAPSFSCYTFLFLCVLRFFVETRHLKYNVTTLDIKFPHPLPRGFLICLLLLFVCLMTFLKFLKVCKVPVFCRKRGISNFSCYLQEMGPLKDKGRIAIKELEVKEPCCPSPFPAL